MKGCDECQIIEDMELPPQFGCMQCHKIVKEHIRALEQKLADVANSKEEWVDKYLYKESQAHDLENKLKVAMSALKKISTDHNVSDLEDCINVADKALAAIKAE